jgi:DNA-binding beta-propeller fold protein YncE
MLIPSKSQQTGSFLGAAVFLLFSIVASNTGAVPTFQYEASLNEELAILRPAAVTFSPDDLSLCVTDEGLKAIEVFDRRGSYQFGTDSMSDISAPRDAAVDARGDFVFTDVSASGDRTIRRLNFLGEPIAYEPESPRAGWQPYHLIIARDGGYVTLDRSGLLAKHDAETGALVWSLDLADPESDRADLMGRPAESPDGLVYVPSAGVQGILVISADGRLTASFGRRGGKRGELSFPVGVSFGPDGVAFVLDRMRHRVLVFDSDRQFVTEFGRIGEAPGDFYHPVAVASSPDGRVWIAQGYQGRVQVFRYRDDESGSEMSRLLGPAETRVEKSVGR